MEHITDPEHEDFETYLDSLTVEVKEKEWKESNHEQADSRMETLSNSAMDAERAAAADAVASSQSDTNSSETVDQVQLVESVSAASADELRTDLDDEELKLAEASNAPLADSNPQMLEELLQAEMAAEKMTTSKVVVVPTTELDVNGNPGWKPIGITEYQTTAEKLGLDPELLAAYSRDTHYASQLTLDQICENKNRIEVAIQFLIRRKSALHVVGTRRIKDMTESKDLTKSKAKRYTNDVNYVPSTHTEVRERTAKRAARAAKVSVAKAKPGGLSDRKRSDLDQLIKTFKTPAAVAKIFEQSGELTAEIAAYLKSKEAQ